MPLAREACGASVPGLSPNTPPRLPLREVDFQRKSLSPPVPESSNPENIKNTLWYHCYEPECWKTHAQGGSPPPNVGAPWQTLTGAKIHQKSNGRNRWHNDAYNRHQALGGILWASGLQNDVKMPPWRHHFRGLAPKPWKLRFCCYIRYLRHVSHPPKMLKKSAKNRCKMGGQRRPRKKPRQIDTIERNVLKKVPKGQPETKPKSSIINPLASQIQQSFIFRSQ